MLVAQWQDAVTRKDMVEAYSFEDFKEVCLSNLNVYQFFFTKYGVFERTTIDHH